MGDIRVGQGPSDRPPPLRLADLATRQHGVVSRSQLTRLGFGASAIKRLVRKGHLLRVHPGVYAVGHRRLSAHGAWLAGVLACGSGAVLSHRSAAVLWGLSRVSTARVEVTAPRTCSATLARIVVHRSRRMAPEDRTVVEGIPVTSVHRTLLDLAEILPPQRLEDALEAAERLRLLDAVALLHTCARNPGRRGLRPLRAWLAAEHEEARETKQELERRFFRFCRNRDLPLPATNVSLLGYEVDAHWPDRNLTIELDSFEFHRTRAAFERDRARDAELLLAGHPVIRLTSRRLTEEPDRIEALIRRAPRS